MSFHLPVNCGCINTNNEHYHGVHRLLIPSGIFSALLFVSTALALVAFDCTPFVTSNMVVFFALAALYVDATFQM